MGSVGDAIGDVLFGRPEQPDIPEPTVPAAPAPSRREDTGAIVAVGSDARNKRVSGGRRGGSNGQRTSGNILGDLGRSGISL